MSQQGSDYFFRSGGGGSSGSTGTGLKNYITTYKASTGSGAANPGNGDIELGSTTGFVLGNVGALTNGIPTGTTPTFGSGASGNLSIATANTSTLGGLFSLDIISSAATTLADSVSTSAFNIDSEDQGKVLTFKIAYKAQTNPTNGNWSGTSSNSYGVAVWDATNSIFLGTAGQFNFTQSSGIGFCTGTFQTGITTASLRLIVYNVTASSGAITLRTDDWFCGPQTATMGATIGDWVAYTPTFVGFGTVASSAIRSRRVGDSLEVEGTFQTGTTTAVVASMTLGYNGANGSVIADLTKVSAENALGVATSGQSSSTFFGAYPIAPSTSSNLINFGVQTSALSGLATANGSAFSSTTFISISFKVPIVGWSSNAVSSADTDTRVISFSGSQTSQAVTANVTNIAFTTSVDRSGAWNGTQFVVPISGDYVVGGSLQFASIGAAQVYKNGSIYLNGLWSTAHNAGDVSSGSILVTGCVAGDLLSVRSNATTTVTIGTLGIYRLSGPAVVQATESVNGRYFASATAISGSLATVVWTTKDFDSHNAMASGLLTIPVTGKYLFNTNVQIAGTIALNSSVDLQLQKNSTAISEFQDFAGGAMTAQNGQITDEISCLAGDVIRIQISSSATLPTISSGNTKVFFSWARIGN